MLKYYLSVCCLLASPLSAAEPTPMTPQQREFFEKSVRPVLATHCYKCHGPKKQEAELRVDSRARLLAGGQTGPAIVPGKPDESELILAINYDPSGYQMPPTGKLDAEKIAALTQWVKMGAPWPGAVTESQVGKETEGINLAERAKHWSFQPVKQVALPTVRDKDWPNNPIDQFILAKLEQANLKPASSASRRTWLRRVTYDLTGLPPTPAELDAFLVDDSPDAHEKVVDRLLASPAYGERWARHWLDLVRFAETAGHEFDYDIEYAAPYRDYVVRALNADLPYNEFVIEHIAGDLVPKPRRNPTTGLNESIVGTGFYWFGQGKHSPVDILAEECDCIDNQLDVLGKTFLGLTIACARCHDHKFDPITAKDYYAMAGFLQSSRRQHAFLQSPDSTRSTLRELKDIQEERRQLMAKALDRHFSDPQQFQAALQSLTDAAKKDPLHPFHAWAVLSPLDAPKQFATAKQNLLNRLLTHNQPNTAFTDLAPDDWENWQDTGEAFHQIRTAAGSISLNPTSPRLLEPGTVSSGKLAPRLQGTLRSPTFTITKPYIHYRMRRVGGKANPGRPLKNGQVHIIVDGFQFIKNPLYGHLTINVKQEENYRWYRQDLTKFLGANAYLEIQDEDDGEIQIDRIVSSDSPSPPPEPANELIVRLLKTPNLTSPPELLAAYKEVFRESLQQWKSNQLTSDPHRRDRTELLIAILTSVPFPKHFTSKEATRWESLSQRLSSLNSALPEPKRAVAMRDGTGEDASLLIRGNHKKPGEKIPRRFLEVFDPETEPSKGSGRLELAHQIADPANPLTARVLVNRLWLHHFGRGIVATPDDFGKMGQLPTHPQLLDWLASDFVQNDWSLKRMHRLMVLSKTYRMSSHSEKPLESTVDPETVDPDNRLLHRMPVRRLEGEAIRDAVLALSGRVNRQMEGESVLPHLTPFMEGRGRPRQSGPLDGNGRRSLYINVRRNFLTPMFLAFDFPTPFTTMGRRSTSNVPAQALTLMNNPFITQQARLWADRVLAESFASPASRIQRLYLMAYSRPPSDEELAAALKFLETQGQEYAGPQDPRTWADLCHVLINVKEFFFID